MSSMTAPTTTHEAPLTVESAHFRITFAEVMLGLWVAIGIIGGLIEATRQRTEDGPGLYSDDVVTHPFVALGLAAIFITIVTAACGFAVFGYMRARLAQ